MSRLVAWFAENTVAANLLMALLIIGGALTWLITLRLERFPLLPPKVIAVTVPYPGATPEDTEEGICLKIEDAVDGIDGIKEITSSASENAGSVSIEIFDGVDIAEVLDDVKTELDAIDTFPVDADEPIIREQRIEERVIALVVRGDVGERNLRVMADQVRDELLQIPTVTKVEIDGVRSYEVHIDVEEAALRRHRLTFDDVARAVREHSIDLPAGSVKTAGGEILFRSDAQAHTALEFERIPLIAGEDGTLVRIGDVARVSLGFEDVDRWSHLDGVPCLVVQVYRVGDQSTTVVASAVREYCAAAQSRLPARVQLEVWRDESTDLAERLDLLKRNGRNGLILVFLVLALFLEAHLAFWVAVGLLSAVLGAIWVMPWLGQSLNFLSSFGFVLVLGILVDDAIVVGENIDSHRARGGRPLDAAIAGTREVMLPVALAVITTGMAFSPMLQLPGRTGVFAGSIAKIVIIAISFSLVESLLILPAHLGHRPTGRRAGAPGGGGALGFLRRHLGAPLDPLLEPLRVLQRHCARLLERFVERIYTPILDAALRRRVLTLAIGLAFLFVTGGFLAGGWIRISFFPPIEGNNVIVTLTLPEGSGAVATRRAVSRIERDALAVAREVEGDEPGSVVLHVLATVGDQPGRRSTGPPQPTAGLAIDHGNEGEVHMELVSGELREVRSSTVASLLRERIADLAPDAIELTVTADQINVGAPISVELSADSTPTLVAAADELKKQLETYAGTFEIVDDYRPGKPELRLEVTPSGTALGVTQRELARQVRQGFYGEEVQRVQIGRDDARVFVRYSGRERSSIAGLEDMRIRLPDGAQVPLAEVARITRARGPATIHRLDGRRTVVVSSDLDRAVADANRIANEMRAQFLPALERRHPGLRAQFGGEQDQQQESFAGLAVGTGLALFLMFGLLAVVFRSYLQPLIVLSAVPFGVAGAVWAHFALGMGITFLSMIGVLALMGVVVNDSLVMIDFINRYHREHGLSEAQAVRLAGPRRFRAILLTSLTTFAGLLPILLERSVQAAFLIPMAVSLAFGVAFATLITLILVPAAYLALADVKRFLVGSSQLDTGEVTTSPATPPSLG